MPTLPAGFAKLTVPFAGLFSKRVFQSVEVLDSRCHPCHRQTHGEVRAARHGSEPKASLHETPAGLSTAGCP
jgi:hypothetical protein